jgi:hypothetical protein
VCILVEWNGFLLFVNSIWKVGVLFHHFLSREVSILASSYHNVTWVCPPAYG